MSKLVTKKTWNQGTATTQADIKSANDSIESFINNGSISSVNFQTNGLAAASFAPGLGDGTTITSDAPLQVIDASLGSTSTTGADLQNSNLEDGTLTPAVFGDNRVLFEVTTSSTATLTTSFVPITEFTLEDNGPVGVFVVPTLSNGTAGTFTLRYTNGTRSASPEAKAIEIKLEDTNTTYSRTVSTGYTVTSSSTSGGIGGITGYPTNTLSYFINAGGATKTYTRVEDNDCAPITKFFGTTINAGKTYQLSARVVDTSGTGTGNLTSSISTFRLVVVRL